MDKKLVVFGLDGGTYTIINPLMDEGCIPFIKSVCEQGIKAVSRSVFPPVTAPNWFALASGLNPGKTGAYDFFWYREDYKAIPVSSNKIKGRCFWDTMGKKGIKSVLFNYPLLYPAYKINGEMVCGIGGIKDERLTYPKSLLDELNQQTGGYDIQIPYMEQRYEDRPELFFKDLRRLWDKKKKAIRYLYDKQWNLFFAVISITDFIQHYSWKYIDETHPQYVENPDAREQFNAIWGDIDDFLSHLVDESTNVLFISDHGFGAHTHAFYTNVWLKNQGYLKGKKSASNMLKKTGKRILDKTGIKSNQLKQKIKKKSGPIDVVDKINTRESKAFSPVHGTGHGAIYVNEKLVGVDKLIAEMKEYGLKENINLEFYKTKELYEGGFVNEMPQILFSVNNFESTVHSSRLNGAVYEINPQKNHSGSHRMEGIFMAKGPDIKNKKIKQISILDITPTILDYFNIKPVNKLDGKRLDIWK